MSRSPTAAAITSFAALVAAAMTWAAPLSAVAQSSYDPAPPPARARRNDAYRPTETGSGLGTLNSSTGTSDPGGYAAAPPQDYRASGPSGYGAPPSDGYTPRYSEPVRPYGSGGETAQSAQSAPQGYGNGGYGNGGYGSAPNTQRDDLYTRQQGGNRPDDYAQSAPPPRNSGYGQPYSPPPSSYDRADDDDGYGPGPRRRRDEDRRPAERDGTYSNDDILGAGHKFFGSVSQGLGNVIENSFKRQGRPNGYILGEEGGGAFFAGLRYGEGTLYTRDAGTHRVYWQGPSIGYDVGGAGSKTMILVYNLRSPDEIYERFGGIDGSAYFVGGVGMTVLTRDHITLAPIRTGVGLRLGANVGYLKFTPKPTWNPF